jgi:hypothetical protein
MRILSKALIFVFFLLFATYLLSSAIPIHAASQTASSQAQTNNIAPSSNTNPDVPDNLHNWTQTVMIEVLSAFSCQLAGIDPINPNQSCLGVDRKTNKIGFVRSDGGIIGFTTNMIVAAYTPPLHTSNYLQYLAQNFGITKKIYAQHPGAGFTSLSPLLQIWTAFRNIVYLFLIIVLVVIGLAIMLRVKIDPRTVMTIQNQIPKIIIGILAVTFSFAIAGLLVDLMWVLCYLVYNVISQAVGSGVINPNTIQNSPPWDVIGSGNLASITSHAAAGVELFIRNMLTSNTAAGVVLKLLETILLGPVGGIFTLARMIPRWIPVLGSLGSHVPSPLGMIAGAIAWVLIFIIITIALLRLWFSLIKAYVQILIDVVLAPFWIIGGIIPGSPISFGGWLKDMLANLLAFPVIIAMLMFAVVFKKLLKDSAGTAFVPPFIGTNDNLGLIGSLVAIGILLMTPNVISIIKTAIKTAKMDTGIGKGVASGVGLIMNTGKSVGGTYMGSQEYTMQKLPSGKVDWGKRTVAKSFAGRMFGR